MGRKRRVMVVVVVTRQTRYEVEVMAVRAC